MRRGYKEFNIQHAHAGDEKVMAPYLNKRESLSTKETLYY